MDPLPPINKVYSLLIQEERQRLIGRSSGPFVESTALAAKVTGTGSTASNGFKNYKCKGRDKPIYSHCGLQGHTVEMCYKLHEYPPGYKAKGKAPMANQVSVQLDSQDSILPA